MRSAILGVVLVASWALLACAACQRNHKLPADPGLAHDSFGVGVSLGLDYAAAEAATHGDSAVEFWLLTLEELNERSPYTERPAGKDLVVIVHDGAPDGAGGSVRELRFYLAEPETSQVRLLGKNAATLTPAELTAWLGEPVNTSGASDGRTHLTYYFSPAEKHQPGIRLVTSHEPDGRCFAFSASFEEQLPR